MIPKAFIQEWRSVAPWPEFRQVEQDLVISRALCDLFASEKLRRRIAFRGGTAINKLIFSSSLRYSEDIDLVQLIPEPVGETLDGIREALGWLGACKVSHASHSTHLFFKFVPEGEDKPMKLKVEINTREHGNLMGTKEYCYAVENSWYRARVPVVSFEPEELFGTKLRALLQVLHGILWLEDEEDGKRQGWKPTIRFSANITEECLGSRMAGRWREWI